MGFRPKIVVIVSCLWAGSAVGVESARAGDTCWTQGSAQFFDAIHYCVSSVLEPQAGITYGPANLFDSDGNRSAWCEGVPGHGIGETITIRINGGSSFRRLWIRNGYGKSRKAFNNNSRIKTIEITTDTGVQTTTELVDQNPAVPIYLPMVAEHGWVQLRILDVYPGARYADTCVDAVYPDFEYEESFSKRRIDNAEQFFASHALR